VASFLPGLRVARGRVDGVAASGAQHGVEEPREAVLKVGGARRMRDACARYGIPLAATALRFTLRHSAVTAAVAGAPHLRGIASDVAYLSTPIPDALGAELEDHEDFYPHI